MKFAFPIFFLVGTLVLSKSASASGRYHNLTVACAKQMPVDFARPGSQPLYLQVSLKGPQQAQIKIMLVDGKPVRNHQMRRQSPIFYDNSFHFRVSYGERMKESLFAEVKYCSQATLAEGRGVINRYAGGFLETNAESLKCSCQMN